MIRWHQLFVFLINGFYCIYVIWLLWYSDNLFFCLSFCFEKNRNVIKLKNKWFTIYCFSVKKKDPVCTWALSMNWDTNCSALYQILKSAAQAYKNARLVLHTISAFFYTYFECFSVQLSDVERFRGKIRLVRIEDNGFWTAVKIDRDVCFFLYVKKPIYPIGVRCARIETNRNGLGICARGLRQEKT